MGREGEGSEVKGRQVKSREGKAKGGKARQGRGWKGRQGEGREGKGTEGQGRAGQGTAGQGWPLGAGLAGRAAGPVHLRHSGSLWLAQGAAPTGMASRGLCLSWTLSLPEWRPSPAVLGVLALRGCCDMSLSSMGHAGARPPGQHLAQWLHDQRPHWHSACLPGGKGQNLSVPRSHRPRPFPCAAALPALRALRAQVLPAMPAPAEEQRGVATFGDVARHWRWAGRFKADLLAAESSPNGRTVAIVRAVRALARPYAIKAARLAPLLC